MRKTSCVILVLLMAIVLSGCKPKPSFTEGKRVVGYYAQWVADQRGYFVSSIPADKLTHINYAFANVTDDGKCVLGDVAADTERVYSAEESVSGKADSTDPAALHGKQFLATLFTQRLSVFRQQEKPVHFAIQPCEIGVTANQLLG